MQKLDKKIVQKIGQILGQKSGAANICAKNWAELHTRRQSMIMYDTYEAFRYIKANYLGFASLFLVQSDDELAICFDIWGNLGCCCSIIMEWTWSQHRRSWKL